MFATLHALHVIPASDKQDEDTTGKGSSLTLVRVSSRLLNVRSCPVIYCHFSYCSFYYFRIFSYYEDPYVNHSGVILVCSIRTIIIRTELDRIKNVNFFVLFIFGKYEYTGITAQSFKSKSEKAVQLFIIQFLNSACRHAAITQFNNGRDTGLRVG